MRETDVDSTSTYKIVKTPHSLPFSPSWFVSTLQKIAARSFLRGRLPPSGAHATNWEFLFKPHAVWCNEGDFLSGMLGILFKASFQCVHYGQEGCWPNFIGPERFLFFSCELSKATVSFQRNERLSLSLLLLVQALLPPCGDLKWQSSSRCKKLERFTIYIKYI